MPEQRGEKAPMDCGSNAADWCLAPHHVECANHDENGDRRGTI